jgi:hypothetical protein
MFHLNLEQDLDTFQGRDNRLADGRRNAAGDEVQHEVPVHDEAWQRTMRLKAFKITKKLLCFQKSSTRYEQERRFWKC